MQKPEDSTITSQIEENVHSHSNRQTAIEPQEQVLAGYDNNKANVVAEASTTTDNSRWNIVGKITNIQYSFKKQNSEESVPRHQYDEKKKELEVKTTEVENLRRELQNQ